MSNFKEVVVKIINDIPKGKVASYGQIAAIAEIPRAARAVGAILNKLPLDTDVPWWRVINNSGRISIKGAWADADLQKSFLINEGIEVGENYEINIEKYRWKASSLYFLQTVDSRLMS